MFKITRIQVLHLTGTDQIVLHTDLPPAVWPYEEAATANIHVARGKGLAYALANFPEAEEIEYITSEGATKVSAKEGAGPVG